MLKLISTRKVLQLVSFWKWETLIWNLEKAIGRWHIVPRKTAFLGLHLAWLNSSNHGTGQLTGLVQCLNQAKYLRDLISTTSFLCVFLTYEALSSMQWIILAGEKRKLSEPRWFGNRILMFLVMRALVWISFWELFMIWETASHISGIATSPSRFKNDFTRFYLNSSSSINWTFILPL